MIRRSTFLATLPVAAAAVFVTACSGQPPTTAPPPSTSAAAPSASAGSSTGASASAAPSSSSSPTQSNTGTIKNPCAVIDQAAMEKIVGVDLGKASGDDNSSDSSRGCSYAASSSGKTRVFTLIGPKTDSLKSLVSQLGTKAKATRISIAGFDDAYLLSATRSGANAVGVAAETGGLDYFAAILGPGDADDYQDQATTMVRTLSAG